MKDRDYIIEGGATGRERLRLLSEVMGPDNHALLTALDIPPGASCVDLGCGGGDVTVELARIAGPAGSALGVDRDSAVLDIARREATELGLGNVRFECHDVTTWKPVETFDVVFSRFLLTHLVDPGSVLRGARAFLRPGGLIVVEDIDYRGHFAEPECPALQRSVELYSALVRNRGADPDIGPRLPALLREAGYHDIQMRMFHPTALEGGIKLLICVTLETIAENVLADGLATGAELQQTIEELNDFARDPHTVLGGPRVFQVWGRAGSSA
jgi:SAM-dependent methyltransferase